MKLLFANSAGYFGGTERWIALAAAELEKRGHTVFVACPDLPHAERFAPPERLSHSGPSSLWDREGSKRLETFCRVRAIEVLVPTSHRLAFTYGRTAKRLGIGVAVRLGIVRIPRRPVVDWYGYGIFPDAIIVNSERIKEVLSRAPFADPAKISVIRNGIETAPLEPAPRTGTDFFITSVGTMLERKGMGHLIRAIALLPDELRSRVRVKLIGGGPMLPRYRTLSTKLGLDTQITFTGEVKNAAAHVAESNLFILLSELEGISNALLEAMNLSVPVYATLAGGHGEFLRDGENAYVARVREPSSVAQDLQRILADPKRIEIGKAGHDTVRQNFSMEKMGNQLETLLLSIVEKRSAGRTHPD